MATETLMRGRDPVGAPEALTPGLPCRHSIAEMVLEVRLADGRRAAVPAWRSRFDLGAQPAIGTIRLTNAPPGDGDRRLAWITALQCAAFHLPYGGASGGIALPAGQPVAFDQVCAAIARAFPDMVLTSRSGCAVGSGTILTGWLDHNRRTLYPRLGLPGQRDAAPLSEDAAALCAMAAITRLHPHPGRWVLTGYDRPALQLARRMHLAGWRLVAAADGQVAIANELGLSPSEIACAMGSRGSLAALVGERGTRRIEAPHGIEAELVVLAGRGGLDGRMASELGGRPTVLELAPGALCSEAEAALIAGGGRVVPDIVAGAGAPILAHLRWLQRRHRLDWTRAEFEARLMQRFGAGLGAIQGGSGESLRQAAVGAGLRFIEALRSGRVQSL